jgi:hypothetical protein
MLKVNAVLLFAMAMVFCVVGQSATAQPVLSGNSCQGALSSLVNEWNAIAFEPPSKPAQSLVAGKDGHVTSGGQFAYMVGLMRQARAECDRGDAPAALEHIAVVRDSLGRSVHPNG